MILAIWTFLDSIGVPEGKVECDVKRITDRIQKCNGFRLNPWTAAMEHKMAEFVGCFQKVNPMIIQEIIELCVERKIKE